MSLAHVFDDYNQNIKHKISTYLSDIRIFLLPNIGIGIGPKNPISVRPLGFFSIVAHFQNVVTVCFMTSLHKFTAVSHVLCIHNYVGKSAAQIQLLQA